MIRSITCLLVLSVALTACGPAEAPLPGETPSAVPSDAPAANPVTISTATSAAAVPTQGTQLQPGAGAEVWYLGANGWAVRIGQKLLIFDYQEQSDPNPPASGEARNLDRGYIHPDELRGLDTYVFVTHSHADHFDRAIYRWQQQLDKVCLPVWMAGWQRS